MRADDDVRFQHVKPKPAAGQAEEMEARCGAYLARTMSQLGYRTFGVGKFHTYPWNEDVGYETSRRCEETYHPPAREGYDYYSCLTREHQEFDFLEQPIGERTEMYYLPPRSPLPSELGAEWWTADRAVEEIAKSGDQRPFFGFISFVGPHPPIAPPIPFNRMYDPDRMPDLVLGSEEGDLLDEEIPFMRYAIWADAINPALARIVKARYYGEISYLDHCVGRISTPSKRARKQRMYSSVSSPIIAIFWVTITVGKNKTFSRPPAASPCCLVGRQCCRRELLGLN